MITKNLPPQPMKFDTFRKLHEHITATMLRLRNYYKYSQEYVATELKINQNTYSKLETGETGVSVYRLYQLCLLYKVQLSEFLDYSAPQPGKPKIANNHLTALSGISHNIGQASRGFIVAQSYYENYGVLVPAFASIQYEKLRLTEKIAYSKELIKLLHDVATILEDMKREDCNRTIQQFLSEIALFSMLLPRLMAVAANLVQ